MYHLSVIGGSAGSADILRAGLSEVFEIEFKRLADIGAAPPGPFTLVDFDLMDIAAIATLKEWIRHRPRTSKVVFVTDKGSHLQLTRAYAIGATDVVHRPIESRVLMAKLVGDVASLSLGPTSEAIKNAPAVVAAVGTLQDIFSSACSGESLDTHAVDNASEQVIGEVEAKGLATWIDIVRTHHSLTYQHCLLVTGLAVAFGQQVGVSRQDRLRLSIAGMLHDIGKARIPIAILEKPGKLDNEEMAVMRKHPEHGIDALTAVPGLAPEMLDVVVHHHEYLDGSGYPHGLSSREISDLVRMMTIADVFGALIERRSYKPPMASGAAYKILLDMGPKLDQDLVRAFEPVATLGRPALVPA